MAPSAIGSTYRVTPLATGWTAPSSCATNVPTIYYGSPGDGSAFSQINAMVNFGGSAADCMPPGYVPDPSELGGGGPLVFSPAAACPAGLATASALTQSLSQTTVVCCPR